MMTGRAWVDDDDGTETMHWRGTVATFSFFLVLTHFYSVSIICIICSAGKDGIGFRFLCLLVLF